MSAPKRDRASALHDALGECMATSIRMEFRTPAVAEAHQLKLRGMGIVCGRDRDAVFIPRSEFERAGVL